MAKAAKVKADKSAGNHRSVVWLSGLACGVLAAVAPGVALVAAGLLAPGAIALRLDKEPGRPVARTILTCGLAGCVHPVMTLWSMGQTFNSAMSIITDPATIGIAWALAGGGWLMTQVAPLVVRVVLEGTAMARATRLRAMREKIAEAWGLEDQTPGETSPNAARPDRAGV